MILKVKTLNHSLKEKPKVSFFVTNLFHGENKVFSNGNDEKK